MEFKTIDEYFEELVENTLHVKLDSDMIPEASSGTITTEAFTDSRGTTAVRKTYSGDFGKIYKYFVNDKPVNSLPENVIELLQFVDQKSDKVEPLTSLGSPIIKGSDYPKINLGFLNRGLRIVADVAGVEPNKIKLSFSGDYLIIAIDNDQNETDNCLYLLKTFEMKKESCRKMIYIDTTRFNIKGLKYSIENGVMIIDVPRSKETVDEIVFNPQKPPKKVAREKLKLDEVVTEEKVPTPVEV